MRLRPMTLNDAEMVHEWRNRPQVANMMFTNDSISLDDHLRWLADKLNSDSCRYWVVEHDDRPVGVAALTEINWRNRRCSWIYYMGEADTPAPVGLAVEFEVMAIAFADLGFEKLTSEVLEFNDGVIRLHERLGFVREGQLRRHIHRVDGVFDVVVLSMLRSEWEVRHARRRRAGA